MLNNLHEDAKTKAADAEQSVRRLETQIRTGESMKEALSQQYDTIRTWADMYDGCDMETKKMILARIMKAVKVRRSYEIEIDLTIDCEQLGVTHPGASQENNESHRAS